MNHPVNNVRNGPTFSEEIDRHEWSQLGSQRYVREYVDPLKPVIITGALEHWPARSKWTFDFFKDHYGDLPLEVDGRDLSMAQLIGEVGASTPDAPAPYLRNYLVKNLPKALQADIAPMPSCTRPNWLEHPLMSARASLTFIELYIGGKGAKFPVLHYDGLHTHAFLMQIQGVKEYIGFAPDQTPYMYIRERPRAAKHLGNKRHRKLGHRSLCAVWQREGHSLHPSPWRDTLHAVRLVAYRAHTFAFHHHLDQRCQCRELVRLPQGFLPLPHGGA